MPLPRGAIRSNVAAGKQAMADIAPIRSLDETAVLEWLRSQPGRRTNLPVAELGGAGDGSDSAPTGA